MTTRRSRDWGLAAAACAAMLLLPALSWLLIPRPGVFVLPAAAETPDVARAAPSAAFLREGAPRSPSAGHPRAPDGPHGPVKGVVYDPDGHPVAGASVACEERDPPVSAIADEEGRFELAEEASGCSAIARHASFFASEKVPIASGKDNALRLSRGGVIAGDVVDEAGRPIQAFMIAVEVYNGPSADRAPRGQTRTLSDERGAFSWENLPPGRYVLTASGEARAPVRSSTLEVEAGRTSRTRITLPRGATLRGRVVEASTHKPIAGANVALDGLTTTLAQGVHPGRTDDQGYYTLEGAPAGPFSVRVTRDGYRTRTVPGLTTAGSTSVAPEIELNPVVDGGPAGEDFAGVGAYLLAVPNGVSFVRLVPSGPAESAGVQVGDVIQRVDGADASSFTVVECMQRLRGPDGSRVSLELNRGGQRVDVTVQRKALTL